MTRARRMWPGATVAIIGGGPSLVPADVAMLAASLVPVIAVNDAYRVAPWANVLYAADEKWWTWHAGVPDFAGLRFSISPTVPHIEWPPIVVLKNTGTLGLETDPTALRTGYNSGYQALNLAVHFGAARVLLVGFDMADHDGKSHWFGDHPDHSTSPYAQMLDAFSGLLEPLVAAGVDVVNCSRWTALETFPKQPLEIALGRAYRKAKPLVDDHVGSGITQDGSMPERMR